MLSNIFKFSCTTTKIAVQTGQIRGKTTVSNKFVQASVQSYIPKQGSTSKNWIKRFGRIHQKRLETGGKSRKTRIENAHLLKKLHIGTRESSASNELAFARNLLHLNWSRFVYYTHALRHTTIAEAVLQARWQQRRTGRMMESLLWQAWFKAASQWNLQPKDVDRLVISMYLIQTLLIIPQNRCRLISRPSFRNDWL
jgi:hypothetical protein